MERPNYGYSRKKSIAELGKSKDIHYEFPMNQNCNPKNHFGMIIMSMYRYKQQNVWGYI